MKRIGDTIIFKDEKLRDEFWKIDPRLRLILCDIDLWSKTYGKEDTVITCLLRTEEEQRALFEAGQAPAKTSVHCVGRGADFRIFSNEILNHTVLSWVSNRYPYDAKRPLLKTLIRHSGTGDHYHLQCMPS